MNIKCKFCGEKASIVENKTLLSERGKWFDAICSNKECNKRPGYYLAGGFYNDYDSAFEYFIKNVGIELDEESPAYHCDNCDDPIVLKRDALWIEHANKNYEVFCLKCVLHLNISDLVVKAGDVKLKQEGGAP